MRRFLSVLLFFLASHSAFGAVHNVSTSWSNINWASVNPGDIVYVTNIASGSLSLPEDGSVGNITWIICTDGSVTSGAVSLASRDYIGLVGITFTGTLTLSTTTNCQIIDCRRTGSSTGISFSTSAGSNNNLIRGMTLSGLSPEGNIISISGNNNVVEYCTTGAGGDFARIFGNYNVVRNNYLGPRTTATTNHVDDLQSYEQTSGNPNWTINNLFEANFSNTNSTSDAHGYIIQDTSATVTLAGGLIRGNIQYNLGRNVGEWNNWPNVYGYNNTLVDCWDVTTTWADYAIWIRGTSSGHQWGNNTFTRCTYNNQGDPFEFGGSGTGTVRFNNHSYLSGTLSGGSGNVSGAPQFTNEAALDYMPASGSPLRSGARYLTQANGAGSSSTTLTVDEGRFLMDGWDMVEGDLIKVGSGGTPVRITDISTNTVTLAAARTWSDNDGVYIVGWDTDIGALAYRAGGYALTGEITNVGDSYTVTPNDADLCRMVVFYQNGVPQIPDYDSPYTFAATAGTTVTANLYPKFAGQTLVVLAEEGDGDPEDTAAPTPNPATFAQAPSAISNTTISMQATAGTDATGPVEYFFNETSGNSGGTDSGWQSTTSYTDTGLTAGTQYTYTIQTRDSKSPTPNTGTASAGSNATTMSNPTAPSGLGATAVSQSQINLAWTLNSSDETGVIVEVSATGGGAGFSVLATLAAGSTSYPHVGLAASTQRFYRVRAYRDPNPDYSSYTSEANATTLAPVNAPSVGNRILIIPAIP